MAWPRADRRVGATEFGELCDPRNALPALKVAAAKAMRTASAPRRTPGCATCRSTTWPRTGSGWRSARWPRTCRPGAPASPAAKAATYEPKRLRVRIPAVAGRIVRSARRRILHIGTTWPWVEAITNGHARLAAFPAPLNPASCPDDQDPEHRPHTGLEDAPARAPATPPQRSSNRTEDHSTVVTRDPDPGFLALGNVDDDHKFSDAVGASHSGNRLAAASGQTVQVRACKRRSRRLRSAPNDP